MSILTKSDSIDAVSAALNFPSYGDFLVALTKLGVEAGQYLQGHTPSVVIYDPEMKAHFIKELNKRRATFESLCVRRAPQILDTLSQAVDQMDVGSLADGLRVFHAEMKILMKTISEAFVSDSVKTIKKIDDTPIIMAIDDSPVTLKFISEYLIDKYLLLTLNDGHSALQALERHTPDLFLIDIMMPGMSGYQLTEKIRAMERFRETPIIFATGLESDRHERAALSQGATAFLKKPLDKDTLIETIEAHLK
jgi:CheY-like chemotaxis protein